MEYNMKYNKRKGFTLAEVMVLLATLTVLMAAFAPVFTRRYTATSLDDVWTLFQEMRKMMLTMMHQTKNIQRKPLLV